MPLSRRKPEDFKLRQDDGSYTTDQNIIGHKAVGHFDALFHTDHCEPNNHLLDCIPYIIDDSTNAKLCSIPDDMEILKAIQGLDPESAPGPDGFSGKFFISCWDIISSDMLAAVQDFWKGDYLPSFYTSTNLVLLPKIEKASFQT